MADTILSIKNLSKSFPGVKALEQVSIDIKRGDTHAVIGENGAGKSTLVKILCGVYKDYEGEIFLNSEKINFHSVADSQSKGISIVHQELSYVPTLTVMENMFLGNIPAGKLFIKKREMKAKAIENLKIIGSNINPLVLMSELTIAEKQMIEIVKAISSSAKVIIFDEPTSSLTYHEVNTLFEILEKLKSQGITIIYISHKLEEIFKLCDRVTVLRDGKVIDTLGISELTREDMIKMMVGRTSSEEYPERSPTVSNETVLSVNGLKVTKNGPEISFDLKKGEVLGFAGLVGAGRTEMAKALFGAEPKYGGDVSIKGKTVTINSPIDAMKQGMAMLTESRAEGSVYIDSVAWNTTFANLKEVSRNGFVDFPAERKVVKQYVDRLRVMTPSIKQKMLYLSGGNQQKVILSKWLFNNPEIFILDEPTRGIDVGAKYDIYQLLNELTEEGKSVIFISSELPEVLAMSDRIVVMANGYISGVLDRADFTAEKVMEYAFLEGDEKH